MYIIVGICRIHTLYTAAVVVGLINVREVAIYHRRAQTKTRKRAKKTIKSKALATDSKQ